MTWIEADRGRQETDARGNGRARSLEILSHFLKHMPSRLTIENRPHPPPLLLPDGCSVPPRRTTRRRRKRFVKSKETTSLRPHHPQSAHGNDDHRCRCCCRCHRRRSLALVPLRSGERKSHPHLRLHPQCRSPPLDQKTGTWSSVVIVATVMRRPALVLEWQGC